MIDMEIELLRQIYQAKREFKEVKLIKFNYNGWMNFRKTEGFIFNINNPQEKTCFGYPVEIDLELPSPGFEVIIDESQQILKFAGY